MVNVFYNRGVVIQNYPERDKLKYKNSPVLVVGLPRSGTTWEYNTLIMNKSVEGIFEPDNEIVNPIALWNKTGNHRFQEVDTFNRHKQQQYFWDQVFKGGWKHNLFYKFLKKIYLYDLNRVEYLIEKRCGVIIPPNNLINYIPYHKRKNYTTDLTFVSLIHPLIRKNKKSRLIIKSVHAINQLRFIKERYNPIIVIIIRKLRNLISSYLRLKMPDAYRIDLEVNYDLKPFINSNDNELFVKIAFQACYLTKKLIDYHLSDNKSILIVHENACLNPQKHYAALFSKLNLNFSSQVVEYLERVNREGTGFIPVRDYRREQKKYKGVLTSNQEELVRICAENYGLIEYY